jgi:hypothetical protein
LDNGKKTGSFSILFYLCDILEKDRKELDNENNENNFYISIYEFTMHKNFDGKWILSKNGDYYISSKINYLNLKMGNYRYGKIVSNDFK